MKRTIAVAALVVLSFVVLSASVASVSAHEGHGDGADGAGGSGISVSVFVDGQEVSDGEKLNVDEELSVNVTVESENELNSLSAELHNKTVRRGINETSHNQSYIIETRPGPNFYTVTARDLGGNTAVHSVNLYREPITTVELKRAVERLEKRKAVIENEIAELEARKEHLERANRNLEERLASLEAREPERGEVGSEGDDGDGDVEEVSAQGREQTLPGFTAVAAVLAVVLGAFAAYRRRD